MLATIIAAIVSLLGPRDDVDPQSLAESIVAKSERHDVDPCLVTAIAYRESSFRVAAVGRRGERGLMQTSRWLIMHDRGHCGNIDTVDGQLECGVSWLSMQLHSTTSPLLAVARYASGRKYPKSKAFSVARDRLALAKRICTVAE